MNEWLEKMKQWEWRRIDRAAPLILAILIIWLCWKLAALLWVVLAPPQVMKFERVELGSRQVQVPNISSFALFQETHQSPSQENLNMQLQGVIVGYPNQFSSAVIKVNETSDRYLVGEAIEGSAYQLAEVYWDHVVLRNGNGTTRELKFKGLENGLNQPLVPASQIMPNSSGPNTSMPTPNTAGQSQEQAALGGAVQKIQEDREQYLKDIGVSASGAGYEVTARTPVALRNKLGLQPGDHVISLNGQTVGQGQSEAQLLEQARKAGQVKLEVKRGDQVMTIQQDFR